MEDQFTEYPYDEGIGTQNEVQSTSEAGPTAGRVSPLLTLIAGLVVGVLIGFIGRPLVMPQSQTAPSTDAAIAMVPSPTSTSAITAEPSTAPTREVAAQSTAEPTSVSASNPSARNAGAQNLMDAIVEQTRHFRGNPDAPVTIVEFSDFQCPYCGRFATETLPQINAKYVETGQVRFGYQHFAVLGPNSEQAAEASECAAAQSAFWEFHDVLFERTAGGDRESLSQDGLKQVAVELGLDTEAFDTCLESGKYSSIVQTERATIQSLGVRGTPAFLINGRPIVGAQPFEVFEQVIDTAIADSNE